eukprot:5887210-Pleurochrysis_carterae.AAC.1
MGCPRPSIKARLPLLKNCLRSSKPRLPPKSTDLRRHRNSEPLTNPWLGRYCIARPKPVQTWPMPSVCSAEPCHAQHRNYWTPPAAYFTTCRIIDTSVYAMPSPIRIPSP